MTLRRITRAVNRKLIQLPLILTLAVSIGLPWVALQTAASASMLVSFAQTHSLMDATIKTFNGENPCDICVAAARGQSTDDDPASASNAARLEGFTRFDRFDFSPPVVEPLSVFGAPGLFLSAASPTADPNRRGGTRLDAMFGVNLIGPENSKLKGHRLAVEGGLPVMQRLEGPQLETDWMITAGWQYSR